MKLEGIDLLVEGTDKLFGETNLIVGKIWVWDAINNQKET